MNIGCRTPDGPMAAALPVPEGRGEVALSALDDEKCHLVEEFVYDANPVCAVRQRLFVHQKGNSMPTKWGASLELLSSEAWPSGSVVFVAADGTGDCSFEPCGTLNRPFINISTAVQYLSGPATLRIVSAAGPIVDAGIDSLINGTVIEGADGTAAFLSCASSLVPFLTVSDGITVTLSNLVVDGCNTTGILVSNGTLTLVDVGISNHTSASPSQNGAGLSISPSGTVIVEGSLTVSGNSLTQRCGRLGCSACSGVCGAGVFVLGSFVVRGSLFCQYNVGPYGSCLYVGTGSVVTVDAGFLTIRDNFAFNGGGGIYVDAQGSLNVLDSATEVTGNTALGTGGGLYAFSPGSVFVEGGSILFEGNSAVAAAGAVGISGTFALHGVVCMISGNKAAGNGGGLYVDTLGSMLFWNSAVVVKENSATGDGGGIFVSYPGTWMLNDGSLSILRNVAVGGDGGGIYIQFRSSFVASSLTIDIENNVASVDGGGFGGAVYSAGSCNFTGSSQFLSNEADYGLAAFVRRGSFSCCGCRFSNHVSADAEGVLFVDSGNVEIFESEFSHNSIPFGAGASINSGLVSIWKSTLSNNVALSSAGRGVALFLKGGFLNVTESLFLSNQAPSGTVGGSVAVISGGDSSWTSCSFSFNSIPFGNGSFFIQTGSHNFSDCLFSFNEAMFGAALAFDSLYAGNCLISNASFSSNEAKVSGGAVALSSSVELEMEDTVFSSNRAPFGGVFSIEPSGMRPHSLGCHDCTISGNVAGAAGGGGVWFLWNNTAGFRIDLNSSLLSDNHAPYGPERATPPVSLALRTSSSYLFFGDPTFTAEVVVYDAFGQVVSSLRDLLILTWTVPNSTAGSEGMQLKHGSATSLPNVVGQPLAGNVSFTASALGLSASLSVQVLPCPPGMGFDSTAGLCRPCVNGVSYSFLQSWNDCLPCPSPDFVHCQPSSVQWKQGYWVYENDVTGEAQVYECDPTNCLDHGLCSANRLPTSPLCGLCAPGFSEWNRECVECTKTDGALIFGMIMIAWMYVCLQHILSQRGPGPVKIILNHLQALSLVLYPQQWFLGSDLFDMTVVSPSRSTCPFYRNGFGILITDAVVPILMLVVLWGTFCVCWLAQQVIFQKISPAVRHALGIAAFIRTSFVLLLSSFQSFLKLSFSFLTCHAVAGRNINLLAPSVDCSSAEYRAVFPLLLFLCVLVCAAPVALFAFLHKSRDLILVGIRSHCSAFVAGYSSERYFWECVILLRKMTLVIIFVVLYREAALDERRTALGVANVFWLFSSIIFQPFATDLENNLELFGLGCLVVTSVLVGSEDQSIKNLLVIQIILAGMVFGFALVILRKPILAVAGHVRRLSQGNWPSSPPQETTVRRSVFRDRRVSRKNSELDHGLLTAIGGTDSGL